MCQMGDGTTNIGAFHESLNLAQLWKLPIVYVIVNNHYGMGTAVERASAQPELYQKACAYQMASERVDGNDVLAVRDAVHEAVERARAEHLPTLMNVTSFRLKGHSVVDPDRYRTRELVEKGRSLDPIPAFGRALLEAELLDEHGLKRIEAQVERMVEKSVAFADESPEPAPKDLYMFDYATEVPNIDRTLPGDHTGLADVEGER